MIKNSFVAEVTFNRLLPTPDKISPSGGGVRSNFVPGIPCEKK